MGNENWKVDSGEWKVDSGEWKVDSGEWKVENEDRKVENEDQKVENEDRKLEDSRWILEDSEWDSRMKKKLQLAKLAKLTKMTRQERQERQTKQTKQKLIDSFWQLYCSKRMEKISIQEITSGAGYKRGTFYKYFTDVYDILEQIESSLLQKLECYSPFDFLNSSDLHPIDNFVLLFESDCKYYTVLLGENGDPSFIRKMKATVMPEYRRLLIAHNVSSYKMLEYYAEYNLSAIIGLLCYCYSQETPLLTCRTMEIIHEIIRDRGTKRVLEW